MSFFKFIKNNPSKSFKVFDSTFNDGEIAIFIPMSLIPVLNLILLCVFIMGFMIEGLNKLGTYIIKNL